MKQQSSLTTQEAQTKNKKKEKVRKRKRRKIRTRNRKSLKRSRRRQTRRIKSLRQISKLLVYFRNKLEQILKKKAEGKNPKKKNNKLAGVEAAKKATEEREAKNKNKKNLLYDL